MARSEPIKRAGRGFEVKLGEAERAALQGLCEQLRLLLVDENPATDPAVARLFPPAYPDDLLQNLDYERTAGNDLLAHRLAALDTVAATIDASSLTEEQLLAWLGTLNDVRIVLGTRLGVTEETTEEDFAGDEASSQSYSLYVYLTWLVGWIIGVLE